MPAFRITLCTTLMAMLTACASSSASGVTAIQFQDVVVPSGLRLQEDAHQSYSRDDGGTRQGHFVYLGSTDLAAAADYVRLRMPQHNWTKVHDEQAADGSVQMRFARSRYRAAYSFVRADGSTTMVVDYTTEYGSR